MPEMTGYQSGVPSWVDLVTTDLDAAVGFYGELFGWTGADTGPESGHYTLMSKDGLLVAAIAPAPHGGPPYWTTYVDVDDADETARRVEAAGGKLVAGPMDVMGAGRMAVFSDITGAVAAAWQAGDHIGAQLVNEPGAFVWNELNTSDLDRSKAFYGDVFGWTWGGDDNYAEARVEGRSVAGVMPRPETMPAEVPDNWLVYFATSDLDRDSSGLGGMGATVAVGPMVIEGTGRFAVVIDPQGAVFGLFES